MVMPARCEECGTAFDPLTGGICPSCRRLLCARHLRGWFVGWFGLSRSADATVCVACQRAGRTAATER
jgi:hypothetical protein